MSNSSTPLNPNAGIQSTTLPSTVVEMETDANKESLGPVPAAPGLPFAPAQPSQNRPDPEHPETSIATDPAQSPAGLPDPNAQGQQPGAPGQPQSGTKTKSLSGK